MISSLIKYRFLFLLLIVGLAAFFLSKASMIQVNADSDQYFHKNDPDYEFYQRVNKQIKTEENLILLAIHDENGVLEYSKMVEVRKFKDQLRLIANIDEIRDITDLSFPVKSFFGIIELPYLKLDDSINYENYKAKIFRDTEITNSYINKDGNSLFLWIELKKGLNKFQIDEVFNKISRVQNEHNGLITYLWGRKHIEHSFKGLLFKEIKRFVYWIFLFLLLALLFIFKRPLAILFPLVVVACSVIIFLGTMVVLDRPLGMMSSIFPTIILIAGVSDVIHMAIKYDWERNQGKTAKKATYLTLNEIGWTTFITSFTTAIGFFTLMVSPMKAMRDLGLELGIIVIVTYLLTLILLPAFFVNNIVSGQFSINKAFNQFFEWLIERIEKLQDRPKSIIIFSVFLLLVGLTGIMFINTNSLEYKIPRDSQLKKEQAFFDSNLGGARTFELVCVAKKENKLNDSEILKSLAKVHEFLSKHKQLNSVKSPILYYSTIHKTLNPSAASMQNKKLSEEEILKYEKYFDNHSRNNYLYNPQKTIFKFKAQTELLGRKDNEQLYREIIGKVQQLVNNDLVDIRVSGMNYLMDLSQKKSIENMIIGLLLAMFVVGATLGLIFKNIAMMILSLLLNLIPLIVSAGILGITGLELRGETMLIFTIGFVIAVDDTIHLLSKYQWERKRGKDQKEAINLAQKECGKAIVATSVIIIGGFLILMKSTTVTISILGVFTALIVLFALAIDLILAPVLIMGWFKKYL